MIRPSEVTASILNFMQNVNRPLTSRDIWRNIPEQWSYSTITHHLREMAKDHLLRRFIDIAYHPNIYFYTLNTAQDATIAPDDNNVATPLQNHHSGPPLSESGDMIRRSASAVVLKSCAVTPLNFPGKCER